MYELFCAVVALVVLLGSAFVIRDFFADTFRRNLPGRGKGKPMLPSGLKGPHSFQELPIECLMKIFEFLNEQELCFVALVCKNWCKAASIPGLWQHADFRLVNKHKYPSQPRNSLHQELSRKYRDYAAHLLAKKATIKHLSFDLDLDTNYETLAELLSSGRCERLVSADMKWADSWDYRRWNKLEEQLLLFHSVLLLLGIHCQNLKTIRTQFNWTPGSVDYLLQFKELEELELSSIPRVHPVGRQLIELLLRNCKRLKKFKIDARILPELVYKYSFKSDTLEVLDISMSVNLFIVEMDLPKLHTFVAKHFTCYQKNRYDDTCFFSVLDGGCPNIQRINDVECEVPGLRNFQLTKEQQWDLRICYCSRHCGSGRSSSDEELI